MTEWQDTKYGRIPSDWKDNTLLDIASQEKKSIISGPFGSNISRKYFVDEGVPVIRGNNLDLNIGTKFIDDGFVFVTSEKAEALGTWATVDDLIFTAAGTIGQVGMITDDLKYQAYIISNKQLRVTLDKEKVTPLFAYYWFASDFMRRWIINWNTGSTIPLINLSILKALPIPIPPLPEQKAIAAVLTSLDDKIDLLHRQNVTLEAMAQTLFRQWFVEEADDDWKSIKIKDFDVLVTDYVANGAFAQLKENVKRVMDGEGFALFVRNTDLKSDFANKEYVSETSYNFLKKTKLFGGEVIISNVGDVGSVFRCPKFDMPMTLGNNIIMLRSKYNLFFYLLFKSDYGQGLIYGITSGSVQQKFNKTSFRNLKIRFPSYQYLEDFEKSATSYYDKIDANKAQIHTLEKLRDILLPKLMSGEVRVNTKREVISI